MECFSFKCSRKESSLNNIAVHLSHLKIVTFLKGLDVSRLYWAKLMPLWCVFKWMVKASRKPIPIPKFADFAFGHSWWHWPDLIANSIGSILLAFRNQGLLYFLQTLQRKPVASLLRNLRRSVRNLRSEVEGRRVSLRNPFKGLSYNKRKK